jgi:hypothetical protein
LDTENIQTVLNEALTQAYGQGLRTTRVDNTKPDATDIDCDTSCKDTPILVHLHATTSILQTKLHNRKWSPKDFVYTDGSQVKGNPTLGAGVANPNTIITTYIDIKSQSERYTTNRSELAAIAIALRQENTEDLLSILTNSSFYIITIINYTTDPTSYNHHLHKDLLQLTDQLL